MVDLRQSLVIEREHAEWLLAERVVPGTEIHQDPDVTWVVHTGAAWRNAGILVRLSASSAERRIDTLLARYQRHGRGMALWISPSATPTNITDLLTARRLRCQKYYPAMIRNLADRTPSFQQPEKLVIRRVTDPEEFRNTPHPGIGRLTTPLRHNAFERLRALLSQPSAPTRNYVAWLNKTPVGAIEVFVGSECAGIHGLTVPERYQGRGIASALIERACTDVRELRRERIGLLASAEGQRLYVRRGFQEVARFGYWYRSFQRDC